MGQKCGIPECKLRRYSHSKAAKNRLATLSGSAAGVPTPPKLPSLQLTRGSRRQKQKSSGRQVLSFIYEETNKIACLWLEGHR